MILDRELLERYAKDQDQAAFAELVRRHLDGVFSAALRRVGDDRHLAQDIAQQVFVELARQSHRLARHPLLTGWLYVTTRNQAVMVVRRERRRKLREAEAHKMNEHELPESSSPEWSRIAPVLDWAIEQLPETDRTAVLLRFIGRKPFDEIGASLTISSDAARMRVERAIDKLRNILAGKGIVSTASLLTVGLSRHAAAAAPPSLMANVTAAALAVTPAAAGLIPSAVHFMTTSKFISGLAAALVIAASLSMTGYSLHATDEARDALAGENALAAATENTTAALGKKLAQSQLETAALQKQWDDRAAARTAQAAEKKRSATPDPKAIGTDFMNRHPEVKQALVAWGNEYARARWRSVFETLRLSPSQIEQFLALVQENDSFGRLLDFRGNTYAQFSVNSGLSQNEVTDRLAALLGPEGMKEYWRGSSQQSVKELTAKTAAGLAFSANPLTTEQAAQLTALYSKYRLTASTGQHFNWDKITQDATTILSPAQLNSIQALRDEEELQNAFNRPPKNQK